MKLQHLLLLHDVHFFYTGKDKLKIKKKAFKIQVSQSISDQGINWTVKTKFRISFCDRYQKVQDITQKAVNLDGKISVLQFPFPARQPSFLPPPPVLSVCTQKCSLQSKLLAFKKDTVIVSIFPTVSPRQFPDTS